MAVNTHLLTGCWPTSYRALLRTVSRGGPRQLRCFAAVRSSAPSLQQQPQQRTVKQVSPLQSKHKRDDYFYAEEAADFESLGLNKPVSDALKAAGFLRPARAQELAIPHILSGKDIVLAAETGSGKTLAYLAPIADMLLHAEPQNTADDMSSGPKRLALVLCPNTALCQQVVSVAKALLAPDGKSLLSAVQVSSSNPPPFNTPDIVVSTPGALMTLMLEAGEYYGRMWTADGLAAYVRHVVVDEADLLVTGGYVKDLTRLLDIMKAGERRRLEAQVMQEIGIDADEFARLPRIKKMACWEGGAPALLAAGYRQQPSTSTSHHMTPEGGDRGSGEASTSGRQFGPYWKRQYVFVAATMPSLTKADVGNELQRRYKDAVWISGDLLHQSKPSVQHAWHHVDEQTWRQVLVKCIQQDPDYQANRARALVFTNNTMKADEVAEVLAQAGAPHVLYHKSMPQDERDRALRAMADVSSGNAIMVSTDAAARGIDLPNLSHVIQADFASNTVDFLHRIGRTARADQTGKVTSLYTDASATLAAAIREYVEAGKPVEECFSRNRSFSRKVKKYGKFIPRGQQG